MRYLTKPKNFVSRNRPKAPLIRSQQQDTASLSSLRSSFASPVPPPPVPSRTKRRESFEQVPEMGFLGAISRLKGCCTLKSKRQQIIVIWY